jgi:alkanesulfonate monooxygenase SsuD/methylene tetrahydromethanopterin reductase-like flavin-dependent oxidoreductase (luciferase family)
MVASTAVRRGLGITAGLDPGLTVARFAAATEKVDLGVGVLPLHRSQSAGIAQ